MSKQPRITTEQARKEHHHTPSDAKPPARPKQEGYEGDTILIKRGPKASQMPVEHAAHREEIPNPTALPITAEPTPEQTQEKQQTAGVKPAYRGNRPADPASTQQDSPDSSTGPKMQRLNVAGTLPKDWQGAGNFKVQLNVNPVILVPGERVRLPVSVNNTFSHALRLRPLVSGLPTEWLLFPDRLVEVGVGEIESFDLVLQTSTGNQKTLYDADLRLIDIERPEHILTIPFQVIFKNTANIIGQIEFDSTRDKRIAHLSLQNHTLEATDVFIAGYADHALLSVTPAQTQVNIPPGQRIRIPIYFEVRQRPWLNSTDYSFSLVAVHSNRAPLDFPGSLYIRPRISKLMIGAAIVLGIAIIILALFLIGGTPLS